MRNEDKFVGNKSGRRRRPKGKGHGWPESIRGPAPQCRAVLCPRSGFRRHRKLDRGHSLDAALAPGRVFRIHHSAFSPPYLPVFAAKISSPGPNSAACALVNPLAHLYNARDFARPPCAEKFSPHPIPGLSGISPRSARIPQSGFAIRARVPASEFRGHFAYFLN